MRGEESSGAVHAGLHFVEDEKCPGAVASLLRCLQVSAGGYLDPSFRLQRLNDEGGVALPASAVSRAAVSPKGTPRVSGRSGPKPSRQKASFISDNAP